MSKDVNIYRIDQCPDAATMEAYIAGRLDKDLNARIDSHAANCPFCADALEGYTMMKERSITQLTSELNKAIDERVRKKDSYRIYWLSVAAVLVVAVISGYLFIRITDIRKERNVTEIVPVAPVEPSIPGNSTDQQSSAEQPELTDRDEASASQPREDKELKREAVISHEGKSSSIDDFSQQTVAEEKSLEKSDELREPAMNAGKKDESRDANFADVTKDVQQAKPSVATTSSVDKLKSETQSMSAPAPMAEDSRAGAVTRSANESEAKNRSKKSAERSEEALDPVVLAYEQQDYKKVIELTARRKDLKGNYQNTWLRAKSFIAIGKSSDAVPLLKELVNTSNPYSTQAEELLRSISKENK